MKDRNSLSGILVVNKPKGMVSKDVSRWLERRLGKIKMGHVGTLDPLAEGVLPILLGRATRLQDFLHTLEKSYEFDVTFGRSTDTMDEDGEVVKESAWDHITRENVEEALGTLQGDIEQVPPIYSAIKYKGQPLYKYARSGKADEVPLETLKKTIHISQISLKSFNGQVATISTTCSKGTYVRSLAVKVGEIVGSCAMVTRLVRSKSSGVDLSQAYSLPQIEAELDNIEDLLVPLESLDIMMPKWRASEDYLVRKLRHGQKLRMDMRTYELGLDAVNGRRATIENLNSMLVLSPTGKALGLGSATLENAGRITVTMRRSLV